MDYENDLVYPNLFSAHIKTSNASSPPTSSLPPPPSSSFLKRIEEYPAIRKASLECYKFDVEREVLARAAKREEEKNALEKNRSMEESIELDLTGVAIK
mmetsp:Transcript_21818/g.33135  ORF Transcript_21818/g.33135 Transcript_21818/m.33135 type:complete len:99 (-) Transcript_21818:357-653(-)